MKIIALIMLFAAIFFTGVRYIERHSIFYPMKGVVGTPEDVGLAYEDVNFEAWDGTRLNGWFVPGEKAGLTFIFCHGNAGNIGHRLEKLKIMHGLGVNIFIFDYRGYGNSEGVPSESGLYSDAAGAYRYIVEEREISEDNIVLYGESIGGAVAVDLAVKINVKGLITEDTFTSVKDLAKIAYPFLPRFMFSNRLNCIMKIGGVKSSKLIIHSVDDEIVPFHLGEKLFDAAREPKEFLKIRGAHNTAFLDSKKIYTEGIRSFLEGMK